MGGGYLTISKLIKIKKGAEMPNYRWGRFKLHRHNDRNHVIMLGFINKNVKSCKKSLKKRFLFGGRLRYLAMLKNLNSESSTCKD